MALPIWTYILRPGEKWSGVIGRGKEIRFTALGPNANVSMLLFNAKDTSEKYNMPDTLKPQHTAYLTKGYSIFSDNGRVLASIVADSVGWHDTITGCITREAVEEKYGVTAYQEQRNGWHRSGEENFLMELVRNGMTKKDKTANINLFSKIYCDEEGDLHYAADNCRKDDFVTLRTEMDTLFIFSNTPNPLDTAGEYSAQPVKIEIFRSQPVSQLDYCVNHSQESRRAFENTWEYYLLME
jgi:uncharacterized protein